MKTYTISFDDESAAAIESVAADLEVTPEEVIICACDMYPDQYADSPGDLLELMQFFKYFDPDQEERIRERLEKRCIKEHGDEIAARAALAARAEAEGLDGFTDAELREVELHLHLQKARAETIATAAKLDLSGILGYDEMGEEAAKAVPGARHYDVSPPHSRMDRVWVYVTPALAKQLRKLAYNRWREEDLLRAALYPDLDIA